MKKIIVMLVWFCLMVQVRAQPIYNPAGSPYLEAVSCTPSFTDVFSSVLNPAALPELNGFGAGFFIEKKYLVEGLNLAALSIAYGKKNSGAGIFIKYFGNPYYNEIHGSVNYGKDIGDINIGASFNYNVYSVAGFDKVSVKFIGFHSILKLSDKFYASLQLINPPFSRIGSSAFKQESEYHAGFDYEASPSVCLSLGLQKIESLPLEVTAALQYRFGDKFYAKAGLFTSGPQSFIGIGWMLKHILMEFSICYHPALGSTPGMLFTYEKSADTILQ